MGSKMIVFLGVLASLLYLYFCLNTKGDIFATSSEVAMVNELHSEAKNTAVEEKEEKIESNKTIPTMSVTETKSTEKVTEKPIVQIEKSEKTPAAFGFMSGQKNQVVGLMSINDKNGKLAQKVDTLCGANNCNKDMRYEKDILVAAWQDETVQIIELLTNGGIENGSIFIEDNVLKLEGTVKDKKTEALLASILKSSENKAFKIETHTSVSISPTPTVSTEVINSVKKITQMEPDASKSVVSESSTKVKQVTKHAPKTVEKHVVKKVVKKIVKKKSPIVTTREVVPAAVMETSLDADARVRAILNDIKSSKPAVGMVAKPHMETTNQR